MSFNYQTNVYSTVSDNIQNYFFEANNHKCYIIANTDTFG